VDFQPMSPDEMQRTMQFLLNHQAKFVVDFDRLTEKVDKLAEKTDRIADSMIVVTSVLGQLITEQRTTNQRIDRLHDVFVQHLRRDHGYTDV
jgi:ribosome biogenesis SPOUT family RNA methylase Rps3